MSVEQKFSSDVEAILLRRGDQGGDLWTTPDKRVIKGAPFSTAECAHYLVELGVAEDDPLLRSVAALLFEAWREDGRFKVYPKGSIFPCQTAIVTVALCYLGYVRDARLQRTFEHFLATQQRDGGWRCNKFFFGRGPETEWSNPLPTLNVLDAFRFRGDQDDVEALDAAVEFLLAHWVSRAPIGPCHYGIGSRFMQVEYPFRDYNLFMYVYVLSFYRRARADARFAQAFEALKAKTVDGQIVVERVAPKLANLSFCKKGEVSELATRRYQEILKNLTEQPIP